MILTPQRYFVGWTPGICFLVGPLAGAFQIRNSAPERDSYYTAIFLMFGPLGHYLLVGFLAFAFQIQIFAP